MWAYDFAATKTHDGRGVRLLTIMDEYSRECLAIRAERSIRSSDVLGHSPGGHQPGQRLDHIRGPVVRRSAGPGVYAEGTARHLPAATVT